MNYNLFNLQKIQKNLKNKEYSNIFWVYEFEFWVWVSNFLGIWGWVLSLGIKLFEYLGLGLMIEYILNNQTQMLEYFEYTCLVILLNKIRTTYYASPVIPEKKNSFHSPLKWLPHAVGWTWATSCVTTLKKKDTKQLNMNKGLKLLFFLLKNFKNFKLNYYVKHRNSKITKYVSKDTIL